MVKLKKHLMMYIMKQKIIQIKNILFLTLGREEILLLMIDLPHLVILIM